MRAAVALVLVPLGACSFDPAVVFDGENPLPIDAAEVPIDGKPDAPPDPAFDAPPIDLDAPDGSVLPTPDAACVRFGVPCAAAEDMGSVSGDSGGDVVSRTGNGDTWFLVRITEDSGSRRAVRANVRLDMPPDVDFDIHAHCGACGSGATARAENELGWTVDELTLGNDDHGNGSAGTDDFDVLIHVVHYRGEGCGPWTLTVTGNVTDPYVGCF